MMDFPANANDWHRLPELEVPGAGGEAQSRRIYQVQSVGFVRAAPRDCSEYGLSVRANEHNVCPLPACAVGGQRYRLPVGLSEWAEHCVGLAAGLADPFPGRVEFRFSEGQYYAEIL